MYRYPKSLRHHDLRGGSLSSSAGGKSRCAKAARSLSTSSRRVRNQRSRSSAASSWAAKADTTLLYPLTLSDTLSDTVSHVSG